MNSTEHRKEAPSGLKVAVITVSDSLASSEKGHEKDESGRIIRRKLEEADHKAESIDIIPDEKDRIEAEFRKAIQDTEVDAVITTGGTGITSRDKTVDVAKTLFEKELPGFGELLRRKSYEEIEGAVILSRSTAGIAGETPIFCLPGSPNSVEVGMNIMIPDLAHAVKHARE